MTLTTAELLDPRTLVPEETFDKIAAYCERTQKITRPYAERGLAECLVFLHLVAENPDREITPSLAVDPFQHAFMLHTAEFETFEREHAGGRHLHHAPRQPSDYTPEESAAALERTIVLLKGSGYQWDAEFWGGYGTCGQGNSP